LQVLQVVQVLQVSYKEALAESSSFAFFGFVDA
jgi:hypothetical protein